MVGVVMGIAVLGSLATIAQQPKRPVEFVALAGLEGFTEGFNEGQNARTFTSSGLSAKIAWNELIVSWTADAPRGSHIQIDASGVYKDHQTKFYTLASWTEDDAVVPRTSVNDQKDDDGDVRTDTLVMRRPGAKLVLRITLFPNEQMEYPTVKHLDLCFFDTQAQRAIDEANRKAWGKVIEVPQRSQMNYEGGNVLCSPTSVSMVLKHWSVVLGKPEIDRDVPLVQRGVYDKTWKGTGNWTFNTAFAAGVPGFRAYVTRFSDISELEAWIDKGIPVVTSLSYDLLKGRGKQGSNDGHLVVLVGFTKDGEPVFNDPGKGQQVRQTYSREHFRAAWATSNNTVYLIYPRTWIVPNSPNAPWEVK